MLLEQGISFELLENEKGERFAVRSIDGALRASAPLSAERVAAIKGNPERMRFIVYFQEVTKKSLDNCIAIDEWAPEGAQLERLRDNIEIAAAVLGVA